MTFSHIGRYVIVICSRKFITDRIGTRDEFEVGDLESYSN